MSKLAKAREHKRRISIKCPICGATGYQYLPQADICEGCLEKSLQLSGIHRTFELKPADTYSPPGENCPWWLVAGYRPGQDCVYILLNYKKELITELKP